MKNKKVLGLLLVMAMLISTICPAFADTVTETVVTAVATDKETYSFGDTVTISGSIDEATLFNVYYTDNSQKEVVLIDSVSGGNYTFSFKLPSSSTTDWVAGRTYTVDMGCNGTTTTTFKIKSSSGGSGGTSGNSGGGSSATTTPSTSTPSTSTPSTTSPSSTPNTNGNGNANGKIDADKGAVEVKDPSVADKKIETKIEKVADDSFKISVSVDGVAQTGFANSSVKAKVPFTLASGDVAANIVVVDADGNVVPRAMYIDGNIVMACGNVEGTFTVKQMSASFPDATQAWQTEAISALAVRGIVNGVGDDKFDPDRNITRAEVIKLIVEMFDVHDDKAVSTFSYVDKSAWYSSYIGTAQYLEITIGIDGVNFDPDAGVTREQVSTMLYRAATTLGVEMKEKVPATEFADADAINGYAKEAVAEMQKAGILQGVGDNAFDAQGTCTRAQGAVAIYKTLQASLDF